MIEKKIRTVYLTESYGDQGMPPNTQTKVPGGTKMRDQLLKSGTEH